MQYLVRFGKANFSPKSRWKPTTATSESHAVEVALRNARPGTIRRLAAKTKTIQAHVAPTGPGMLHPNGVPRVVVSHSAHLNITAEPTPPPMRVTEKLFHAGTRAFPATSPSHARILIEALALSAGHTGPSINRIYQAEALQPNGSWQEWLDPKGLPLTDPNATIFGFSQKNPPPEGSLWLVWVECRPQVIAVAAAKPGELPKGFFIPGQEPCWHFNHVSQWICQVNSLTPGELP